MLVDCHFLGSHLPNLAESVILSDVHIRSLLSSLPLTLYILLFRGRVPLTLLFGTNGFRNLHSDTPYGV